MVGSFLNVLIYRTTIGEDWVKGRSRCDDCKKGIAWYDNIPLVSYILLGGKCRHCKKQISVQHVVIELLTGILFGWWYVIGFTFFKLAESPLSVIQPVFWLVIGILLLIIFVTDWLYQIIPLFANVGLGGLALAYRISLGLAGVMQWRDVGVALLAGGGLMLFLVSLQLFSKWVFKKDGMGGGDIIFALGMGILLGWPRALVAMMLAVGLGAVAGVVFIALKLIHLKDRIAFGPFLVLGSALALVWGNQLWAGYMRLMGF